MFIFVILILIPALAFAQNPHDQLENKLFGDFDENGDGQISELEHEDQILSFDADKDTIVTKDEFSAGVDKLDPEFVGHEDALFTLLDRDSNGHVDKADIDDAFELADLNGDGHINHHEFHVVFQTVVTHVG